MVDIKLFSGQNSRYLAEKIAANYGQNLSRIDIQKFSDGEIHPVIQESVRGAYVFFIQSTPSPPSNIMELLLMIDAAKRASAGYITAVIPYFGYARQDRKDQPRVPISAKLIANLLEAAGANRVMTMDFHADQIQGFFDIPVDHLRSEAVFMPYLEKYDLSNTIFAAPDVGGVKRARKYAKVFNTPLVICDKQRIKPNEVAEMTVIGEVEGKDVIIVDDLADTAGTLCRAADVLKEKGALNVIAICTHPVLSGKAYENIENSQLSKLIVTDTIPLTKESEKITVLESGRLFARAIRNTHEHKSIAALYLEDL
ncbi:ribose-phosphate pyrophosphokinase [Membranicola marinus]|uniref:ribose-phosphate diphosphokinase n=1 Tax=Membranihabitans marinus TaxID=1227546 RepID=A0A953L8V1_9BACT|nr:ribose-phosphate pyrophosphokinase [Membranihabitans marinus]MBY5960207.1 ribose-phosphate pyrophosphokinase [Membranihabitans marinus]